MTAKHSSQQRTPDRPAAPLLANSRAPAKLQFTTELDSSKIDWAEQNSALQSVDSSSFEKSLNLNDATPWIHPSCEVKGRQYTPEEKLLKRHMEMILAVDPCASEKIAIVGHDSDDMQRAAHALNAYTANIHVSCFRVQECPADIIKVAEGPWDKIVCQLPDWTAFEPWSVACRTILAPEGQVIVELEWANQNCWRSVAWRYARLSWRKGLKLERVNGCNSTVNRLGEHRLNRRDQRHVSRRFHSLANELLRINSSRYKALATELRNAANVSFNQGRGSPQELVSFGDRIYGVFSLCDPQDWFSVEMIHEAEEASDDEEDSILEGDCNMSS
ncbi:hypothetical protein FB567DRAFT_598405 [Paraphoma chrysanthemicola]|uniref:Methyltransferase domain-containing protein n=1 Tax=Paraphoma chrysanthemicola TaxID=798071 RepID=A0A8K0QT70_9PLEO|nr:hypothetical protein FB567DRAFT_598405 [Paraphoma chrysanthemicola]